MTKQKIRELAKELDVTRARLHVLQTLGEQWGELDREKALDAIRLLNIILEDAEHE